MKNELDTYRYFLGDLGDRFAASYREAEDKYSRSPPDTPDHAFDAGRRLAYYEVITTIRSLATAFGLPLSILHLDNLDPDQGHY